MTIATKAAAVVLAAGLLGGVVRADDLAEVYPATLDYVADEEERVGHEWTAGPEDVWDLRKFEFEVEDRLKIKLSACTLVIGHAEGNAMFAVVLPKRPAKIDTELGGGGEKILSLYLRFHPSRIGELFPDRDVRGRSDDHDALYHAYRIYSHKWLGQWSFGFWPSVPPKQVVVLDAQTDEGVRRCYWVDTRRGRVDYKSGFVTRGLPEVERVRKRTAEPVIETAWETIEERYPRFDQCPDVDWAAVLEAGREHGSDARDTFELGIAVRKMMDALGDEDIWVWVGGELVTRSRIDRQYNASWLGIRYVLGDVNRTESGIAWRRTPHDLGYVNVLAFDDEDVVLELDEVLGKRLGDTWAMVIDLRFTRSGEREIAEQLASRFVPEETVYGYRQVRKAEAHDAFDEPEPLSCGGGTEWTYEAPIYLLVGPGTARYGEQLALMLQRAPRVITMGAPTPGVSPNVEKVDLGEGLELYVTLARQLDPDGQPVGVTGIDPEIPIEFSEQHEGDEDPVLYQALEKVLQTPSRDRRPANRNAPQSVKDALKEAQEAARKEAEAKDDGEAEDA